MRERNVTATGPNAAGARSPGYWVEVALCALSLPAIGAEAHLWMNQLLGSLSGGPWFLVELFGGFAATVLALIFTPIVAALAVWGIATKRWRGIHAVGAYALAVLNLRVAMFFLIPYVVSTPGGGRTMVRTFAVLFLAVIPLLYAFGSHRKSGRSGAAAA